jgi:hypothetical protein
MRIMIQTLLPDRSYFSKSNPLISVIPTKPKLIHSMNP